MSTGVGCVLYVNGARFADGSPGDDLANPTALSGLKIDWGRDTTVDQPETGTCTFQVMDRQGGDGFLGLLTTGLTIDVFAEGTVYPDPTESTFLDPGFETGEGGRTITNALASLSTRRVADGAQALQVYPSNLAKAWTVRLAPGPFQANGTHPDAWDDIVRTDDGQQWTYGVTVFVPRGITLVVRPVEYTGPWSGSYITPPTSAGQVTVTGDGTWQTVSAAFYPDQPGAWVGVQVTAWPNAGIAWSGVEPADLTWLDADQLQDMDPDTLWWADLGAVYIDDVAVLAPAEGVDQQALVFHGRITDLKAQFDDNDQIQGPVIDVTAVDFTADLDNVDVGDDPWPDGQKMAARFARVIALSGMPITTIIDARPGAMALCYQDVDSQAATGLLQDLATSTDAVLWSAVHQTTGQYLWVEDTRGRVALSTLAMLSDNLVHIVPAGDGTGAMDLSACWVLRDPVEYLQDVSDVFTRAAVTWNEYVPPDGSEGAQASTTEHTVTVVDSALESTYGRRREQVTTLLHAEADATDVATAILTRTSSSDWRVQGVTVDDDILTGTALQVDMMLTLLDGTRRIGLPVRITDLPPWSPSGSTVAGYVEGGTYTFEGGTWSLDLTISRARGTGQGLLRWVDSLPDWRWTDYAPDIRWSDLQGVAPPVVEAPAPVTQPEPEEALA